MSVFSNRGASDVRAETVAVVSMSGRYPGAEQTADGLWDLLKAGQSRVGRVPRDRWDVEAALGPDTVDACRHGSFLADVAGFDPDFFGMSREAAALLDPQVRLFLEVAWEALEIAGYAGDRQVGRRAGVWVGYGHDHYRDLAASAGQRIPGFPASIGLAGKFSGFADWRGPSVVVNALCASSLVALHQAVASLRARECDMALVGGVSAALSPDYYREMNALGVLSPTGESKPFDAGANGFVPGEGVGAVVLKRFDDARRDGDDVIAVIRGTAVNHGGQSSRLFAMNLDSQVALLGDLFERSGIPADSIGYVEAHAVGTRLGDAVEAAALSRVFASAARPPGYCVVGSLKSVLGHMEAASGIAALQKALLSLQRRELLPTTGVARPNSALKPGVSPLRLLDAAVEWPAGECARRACVMSMSMHGVNAAVVLEEAPAPPPKMLDSRESPVHALLLSAAGPEALAALAVRYREALAANRSSLGDVCFTAAVGRAELPYRAFAAGDSVEAVREALWNLAVSGAVPASQAKFALHYRAIAEADVPGQAKIAREQTPALKRELAARGMDRELQGLEALETGADDPLSLRLAIVARDVARATFWRALGVVPECVSGRGVGAISAACVAGRLPLDRVAAAIEAIVGGRAIDLPIDLQVPGEASTAPASSGDGEGRRPTLLSAVTGQAVAHLGDRDWTGMHEAGAERSDGARAGDAALLERLAAQGVTIMLNATARGVLPAKTALSGLSLIEEGNDAMGRRALGALWSMGVAVRWREVYRGGRHGRVRLPTYPFQRARHWFRTDGAAAESISAPARTQTIPKVAAANAAPEPPRPASAAAVVHESAAVAATPRERIAMLLGDCIGEVRRECAGLAHDRNLLEAGLDSADLTATTQLVSQKLGVELSTIFLFEHSSIHRATTFLLEAFPTQCASSTHVAVAQVVSAAPESAVPAPAHSSGDAMHAMLMRMEARIRALEEGSAVN
ncbi:beta-ketoacyl synthase N-terminal-like domain-containing protein [Lysobacter hankyongensis]|uniref:Ketosynthase family 3 (KS3) domain-containing protein n=1 Tax=Lysobacter hankyongensis TaxID=1176535 RepID=A0ABP9AJB6_9GAMM